MQPRLAREGGILVVVMVCLAAVATGHTGYSSMLVHHARVHQLSPGRTLMSVAKPTPSFFSCLSTTLPAALVIISVGAVATAAGAGGGALFVPLFSAFLQFSVRDSTALSQAVITGGAVAGTSFALFQKHPALRDRPLIQFDLALVLIPSLLLGTSIGVLLNRIFPVWLITLCLIVILTYLTYKTTAKGLRLHYQEQQTKASKTAEAIRLQAVQVDQGLAHAHSDAVHNLLRSISEEPASPQHSFPAKSSALLPHSSKDQPALSSRAGPPPVSLAVIKLQHLQSMDSLSSTHSGKIATSSPARDVELLDMAESHSGHQKCNCKHGIQPVEALQLGGASNDSDDADIVPDDDDSVPFLRQQGSQDSAAGFTAAQAHAQMQLACGIRQKYLDTLHQLPWHKLTTAGMLWVVFAGLQLLKAAVHTCSTAYWLLYCTQVVAAVSASAFFIRGACQGQDSQTACSMTQQQVTIAGQPEWTRQVLTMASLVGVGGGAVAGTVGMGGGVVMGPLLLYLQVPPAASAATSTLMILFSSSAATLSFAVDGRVNAQYAFIYGSLNFFASLLGVFLVGRAVKRSGRSSIIVLLLAMMMASGALISAVFGGIESIRDIRNGQDLAFTSLCA